MPDDLLQAFEAPPVAPAPEEAPPPLEPPAAFPFGTLRPEVSFLVRDAPPPAPAYIGPDEHLRVELRNAISGLAVHVHARLLRPDGQIVQGLYEYKPTADRALNTWTQDLPEGFLLSLVADGPSGAKPGGCYVRVLLYRGTAPTLPLAQVLVSGYLVTGGGLAWPYPRWVGPVEGPGRLRWITGTDPPPGGYIVESVPTGARWRIIIIYCEFVTSSSTGNRYVHFYIYADGAYRYLSAPVLAQGPNSGYRYEWAPGITARVLSGMDQVQDALPEPFSLPGGTAFGVFASGSQAGDNFSAAQLLVEEWIEP